MELGRRLYVRLLSLKNLNFGEFKYVLVKIFDMYLLSRCISFRF